MDVVLIVEAKGLKEKEVFEKHLKKEGFNPIDAEAFAYSGKTTTHLFSTRAYIVEVVEKGLNKAGFDECKIIFQVGENPIEAYIYDTLNHGFKEVTV